VAAFLYIAEPILTSLCSAVTLTLLAFSAEHCAAAPLLLSAGRAAIDLLPAGRTAADAQKWTARWANDMGQTDSGRPTDR